MCAYLFNRCECYLTIMSWIGELFFGSSIAHQVILIALTIAIGLLLGRVKIFGVSLGATFILFVGILFGELGMKMNHDVLHFFKEFGLILFVFSIGLQVGPSFFGNFKKGGLRLNLLATLIVLLSVATTLTIFYITDLPIQTLVGIMSGAITNTPGLGAAQQAYADISGISDPSIAMGYAIAYPLGVVGIILSIILIRFVGRIDLKKEEDKISATSDNDVTILPLSLVVQNAAIFGKSVASLSSLLEGRKFVVSRILKSSTEKISIVGPDTILEEGDKIFVIIDKTDIDAFRTMVGKEIQMDRNQWVPEGTQYVSRQIVISNKAINGRRIKSLNLRALYGVNITRVNRAGIDMVASPDLILQQGDKLTIVGSEAAIKNIEPILGNSLKHLHEPNLITIFIGVALGILLGSIPFFLPGIPQPIKLGLAGGPLIVAILVARFGYRYHMVTYTTESANLLMREVGISVFLACVGLGAGNGFVDTLVNGGGLTWVAYGFIITMVPLLIVSVLARFVYRIDYFTLAGLIAGSTTDPPALSYGNTLTSSDAVSVGYATVYPLTMFLRVLMAQLMILFFM